MTVAAYVRVSSRGQSTTTQRDAITRAAEGRGFEVNVWYSEKIGGAAAARPQLELLRQAVKAGEIKRIFVYRIDRLSRGSIRETLSIVEEFRLHGCQISSVSDGFDLDGPWSDIVIAVMAWGAQMEKTAIGERIAAARTRVEASGGSWGRPRRVNQALADRCRKMAKENGSTVREIAIALKIPKSTVGAVLSENGAYKRAHASRTKKAR